VIGGAASGTRVALESAGGGAALRLIGRAGAEDHGKRDHAECQVGQTAGFSRMDSRKMTPSRIFDRGATMD
jgi:hypothetical protein